MNKELQAIRNQLRKMDSKNTENFSEISRGLNQIINGSDDFSAALEKIADWKG